MRQSWRGSVPDRLVMSVPGLLDSDAQTLAEHAVDLARQLAPKSSGISSAHFAPLWGTGFYGIQWFEAYVWYQEMGIRPFTMRNLAGRTIPMWIKDPTGSVRRENPRAETRVTVSGVTEVKIFRKAAPIGARKTVTRRQNGRLIRTTVPASYPGAPGRIATRESRTSTTPGRVAGAIAQGNVGVRWRHPGLARRSFLRQGLVVAAQQAGVRPGIIRDSNGRFR